MRPLPPVSAKICTQGTQSLSTNPGLSSKSSFGQWFSKAFSGVGGWQLWQVGQGLMSPTCLAGGKRGTPRVWGTEKLGGLHLGNPLRLPHHSAVQPEMGEPKSQRTSLLSPPSQTQG